MIPTREVIQFSSVHVQCHTETRFPDRRSVVLSFLICPKDFQFCLVPIPATELFGLEANLSDG